MTFALGRPISGLLFGDRYEPSGTYLSILAVGYLIQATFGFNGMMLAAHGHTRTVAVLNATAAAAGVVATLVLVPAYGALGAAIAAASTLISQSVLLQLALRPKVGIPLVDREAVRVFAIIIVAVAALTAVQALTAFGWWTIAAVGAASLGVVILNRDALRNSSPDFPEVGGVLERLPGFLRGRRLP